MTPPDLAGVIARIDGLPDGVARNTLTQLAVAHRADYEAAVKYAEMLAQGAASRANPYGSYADAKHGQFDAPSAAEVAQDVDPEVTR